MTIQDKIKHLKDFVQGALKAKNDAVYCYVINKLEEIEKDINNGNTNL